MPHQQKINDYLISVVIPTCDRKGSLMSLLASLNRSIYPISEVIIVDSSDYVLVPEDYMTFTQLSIRYLRGERSVCIQRNLGIREARSPFIFLCDDDMEVPADYLQLLVAHIRAHPEAGAVTGLVLQEEDGGWQGGYPVRKGSELIRKFIFQQGIWGEIECPDNLLLKRIKRYYRRKGNHISRAGWPVLTQLSGDYVITPIYTLGASLVRKKWLRDSPYDEVLDRNGIGDNYGVAVGFPAAGIHLLPHAVVYHYRAATNRLQHSVQYLRRVLALDYFIQTKKELRHIKKGWLIWSLTGNCLSAVLGRDRAMLRSALKTLRLVAFGPNPYLQSAKNTQRITEPTL